MLSFEEFLIESENTITIKKATTADRKKGESYVVYDTKSNSIIEYDGKRMHGLKRESAKAVAATKDNWKSASATWAHDNDIK